MRRKTILGYLPIIALLVTIVLTIGLTFSILWAGIEFICGVTIGGLAVACFAPSRILGDFPPWGRLLVLVTTLICALAFVTYHYADFTFWGGIAVGTAALTILAKFSRDVSRL